MQRILLYDLKLESYVYHSTPCPSMEGVVVAGYHSAIGDKVTLTDRLIDWRHYDIIYIIGDNESLVYDPEWLGDSRVVPLGKAFGNHNAYDPKWEQYPLNSRPYVLWAQKWQAKYPKYNPERMSHFYIPYHKLMVGGEYQAPPKGSTSLILDQDWLDFDPNCNKAMQWGSRWNVLVHPLKLDGKEKAVFDLLESGNIRNAGTQIHMSLAHYRDKRNLARFFEEWEAHSIGSKRFAGSLILKAYTEQAWRDAIIEAYHIHTSVTNRTGIRLQIRAIGEIPVKYQRLLSEMRRWSYGAGGASLYYSPMDYFLFEAIRSDDRAGDFLQNPILYVAEDRQGSNKFKTLWPAIEKDEDLFKALLEWRGSKK